MSVFNFTTGAGKPPVGIKTWPSWLGAALLSLISLLPLAVHRALALGLAKLYVNRLGRNGRHMRTVTINLQACYPDYNEHQISQLRQQYFETLVIAVLNMPRQWWRSADYLRNNTSCTGLDAVLRAREEGTPCVFLITHTVSLDAGMISLSPDLPFTGFYKPFNNPVVDWLIRRARLRFGGQPFARGEGFRDVIRRVTQHDILCYLCDEDYGPDVSVFAPFFGHEKATLKMLPKITRLTKALVFPMATYLNTANGRYEIHIQPALADYPSGDARLDATTINEAIVQSIKHAPEQYLWKLQLFRSCPQGGDSRYAQIARGELTPQSM